MPTIRESSFMPTVKCSLCDRQVEISKMGEHVCSGFAAGEVSPPESDDDDAYPVASKYGRRPPPPGRVDIPDGNQTYLNQGQLTPASYTSVSPITPADQQPASDTIKRPVGYSGYGRERRNEPAHSVESPVRGAFFDEADKSPRIPDPPVRPTTSSTNRSGASVRSDNHDRYDRWGGSSDAYARPGTSSSSNVGPPRQQRQNGYGGLGAPPRPGADSDSAPLTTLSRADTFPRLNVPADVPPRSPSAPGFRPDRTQRDVSRHDHERKKSSGVQAARAPPRTELTKTAHSQKSSVNLAAEFGIGNPYHAASPSTDSGYSSFAPPPSSKASTYSGHSGSSRTHTRQKPSDTSQLDALMATMKASLEEPRALERRVPPPLLKPSAPLYSPVTISPMSEYPEEKLYEAPSQARRYDDPPPQVRRYDDQALQGRRYDKPTPQGRRLDETPPQVRRYDKAGPQTRRHEQAPRGSYDRPEPSPQYEYPPELGPEYYGTRGLQRSDVRGESPERNGHGHGHGSHRAVCKSCRMPIKGKSISSADGRLTGKYHKACFVCATCAEPFTSAEFYVLNDKPYCEQHYHKLNGSLCGACGRGIEGQYVEDEALSKYHVGCFCCLDCEQSLSDGYFEIDNKSFCERCALRRVRRAMRAQQPEPEPESLPSSRSGQRLPPAGLPGNPRQRGAGPGLPGKPKQRLAPAGMPKMNKRMTRLGML